MDGLGHGMEASACPVAARVSVMRSNRGRSAGQAARRSWVAAAFALYPPSWAPCRALGRSARRGSRREYAGALLGMEGGKLGLGVAWASTVCAATRGMRSSGASVSVDAHIGQRSRRARRVTTAAPRFVLASRARRCRGRSSPASRCGRRASGSRIAGVAGGPGARPRRCLARGTSGPEFPARRAASSNSLHGPSVRAPPPLILLVCDSSRAGVCGSGQPRVEARLARRQRLRPRLCAHCTTHSPV